MHFGLEEGRESVFQLVELLGELWLGYDFLLSVLYVFTVFQVLRDFLHLSHRPSVLQGLLEDLELQRRAVEGEEGAGVAHVDFLFLQGHLHLCRELQQAEVVGDGRAAFPHALRHLLLCHACLFEQVLIGQGYFDGVEVLALDVLHESHLHDVLVIDGTDVGRYGLQPGHL